MYYPAGVELGSGLTGKLGCALVGEWVHGWWFSSLNWFVLSLLYAIFIQSSILLRIQKKLRCQQLYSCTHPCTDPCTARLACQPRPQSDHSWILGLQYTAACFFIFTLKLGNPSFRSFISIMLLKHLRQFDAMFLPTFYLLRSVYNCEIFRGYILMKRDLSTRLFLLCQICGFMCNEKQL